MNGGRAVAVLFAFAAGAAAQRVANVTELRAAIAAAQPGTVVEVAPGDYDGWSASDVHGAKGSPIVVRAADMKAPPVFRGGVQLSDVGHLELHGLVFAGAIGNGLNIDDGGTFATPSHHLVLRDLAVRDVGGKGNHDGIKLSGVDDFRLENCTVERWGRGGSAVDMVGCHRGIVLDCTFRDREQDPAATGVQMKGGTRDVTVRACRFEHAGQRAVNLGGSTGLAYFRPKAEGFEAKDLVVEGCTFVGSLAPVAFVGCDGAIVRHNTFFRPGKWVLRILQETREPGFVPCRNGAFTDNLVVVHGLDASANVGPDTAPATFTFARNWWFRDDGPQREPQLPARERDAAGGRDPKFADAANGDLRLRADSPAKQHGAPSLPADRR
ncbi:MAG: right-handed parallel beta-helix repeat-containing protein [Planctomycetes bacterium]|nr:right-handed parallel beta-helix repeat-containing protein [Planctomycetota bacterium]